MNKSLVSIIVPVYNVEKYLDECVESLLAQTYKNIEILLIDDGSTDSSGEMCDKYSCIDDRIKSFHKNNGGLSDTRNYGIDMCCGNYIVFVDSDDWISVDYIEYLMYIIERYNADISVSELVRITDEKKIISMVKDDKQELFFEKKEGLENLLQTKYYSTSVCGKLYRRKLFDNIRFPVGKLFEDIPVTYSLYIEGVTTAFGRHSGYYYRCREDSITTKRFTAKRMDAVKFLYDAMDRIEHDYPEFYGETQKRRFMINFNIIECLGEDDESKKYWPAIRQEMKKYRKGVFTLESSSNIDKLKAVLSVFDYKQINKIMSFLKKLKRR